MILLDPQVVHRLGWALVHFVWQGAALAALAAVMLRCLRRRPAAVRYLAACAALAAMVVVPAATLSLVPPAPTVTHRDMGDGIRRSETPAAVVWTSLPADAPAATPSSRSASWAARIAPAIESALPPTVLAWLTGALAVSVWYAGGWVWVRRLIWRRAQPAAERWRQVAADLARRMRVSRPVRLLESAAVRVPTLVGCLRPVILLPASVLTGLAPEQIEALLAHELAHVRRWDYLVNLCQTLAEVLFFYHPAVWLLSRRIRVEREQCCDDAVVATCGDRVAYARALATLGQSSAVPAAALAAGDGRLLARIRRILAMEDERRTSTGRLAGSVALAGIALAAVAVLTAACGLCAAGGAGAGLPSSEATRSTTAGGEPIQFVTPDGDIIWSGVASPRAPAPTPATLLPSAGDPLASHHKPAVGGKRILIEARFIQVPADAKEKMEAALAKVGLGAPPGSGVLTEEQAKAFLDDAAALKAVKTLATPKVLVVENQEAQVFVGEHRPLSLPLVEVGAPPADNAGIRTTIIFPVGAGVSVTAALSPDGQSVALKAEQCVTHLEQKGGKELLTEARGEVQCAVPLGHWMLVRVPSKSYRLTAIGQKDDPASGKILMEVLREPLPDAGKAPYDIWVLLRPSLAQAVETAAGTANAEAAKAPIIQAEAAVAVAKANAEAAKAMAAAAEADAVGAASELKRCQELFAAKLISQKQLDAAATAARAAAAKHALNEIEAARAAFGYRSLSEDDKKRLEETNRLLDNDLDVDFSEMPLADVLDYLREAGRLNIVVSPDLPASVLTRPLINMNVKQVATKHILRIALVGSGLDYEVGPGYVLILARRTPEQADLFRKVYTLTSIPQPPGEKAGGPTEVRVFALRYAESDAVARLWAKTYPADPAKVVSDARANRLVVEASPERFKQIEELIKQFDQPANETPKQGQGVAPPPMPAARGAPAADAADRGRP
jgi:beta-lactamase regulating signal transducer with metallopeptidase domain